MRLLRRLLSRVPRPTLVALLLIPVLLLIDALCYQVALPVRIDVVRGVGTLTVGSTRLALGKLNRLQSLQFVPHNPLVHEYQIDGSDSTNNLDLDTGYLSQIAGSPYYRLQAWMRDLDGTSRWRDLVVQAGGREIRSVPWPGNGERIALPNTSPLHLSLQLQRPETPMSLNLVVSSGTILQITLDRNDRLVTVINLDTDQTIASAFFPLDIGPFAAMVIDTLVRILLWAVSLLLAVQLVEAGIGLARARWSAARQKRSMYHSSERQHEPEQQPDLKSYHRGPLKRPSMPLVGMLARAGKSGRRGGRFTEERFGFFRVARVRLFRALHPVAFIGLGCSLVYVVWIALVEYHGEPHIYDASAYFFAAKMYASGQLSVPAPAASELFPGPFMVIFQGRWFGQYEPGTSLTLVPGIWLGVPWLVEPVLGTLALLGIGLIAARLYDRRVATLAVLLGCLSPFYSYLAASYLSHTVALFYLVWGLWTLLRFAQGESGWNILLCGCCFGMAVLTRDLVALLYIMILVPGVVIITWKRGKYRQQRLYRFLWWLVLVLMGALVFYLYAGFNLLLTGNLFTTPRNLFFPGDTWGFGVGIGFYGQHTLAAGFVNLDELLTILQIDLFGWPFYLTLAFIALPFLSGQARKADWFLLITLVLTVGSYIGYFYHGIYLGPRYLYEDLPFLLILSARGILTLGAWGVQARQRGQEATLLSGSVKKRPAISLVTLALVVVLVLCDVIYYLPRQATLYQNFTGLPNTYKIDIDQIYHSPVHHAIVVTDDLAIYQIVLFPLNTPDLNGDVVYAWFDSGAQIAQLRKDFPGRAIYELVVNQNGSVSYFRFSP